MSIPIIEYHLLGYFAKLTWEINLEKQGPNGFLAGPLMGPALGPCFSQGWFHLEGKIQQLQLIKYTFEVWLVFCVFGSLFLQVGFSWAWLVQQIKWN
jgi:hypothetical protein